MAPTGRFARTKGKTGKLHTMPTPIIFQKRTLPERISKDLLDSEALKRSQILKKNELSIKDDQGFIYNSSNVKFLRSTAPETSRLCLREVISDQSNYNVQHQTDDEKLRLHSLEGSTGKEK